MNIRLQNTHGGTIKACLQARRAAMVFCIFSVGKRHSKTSGSAYPSPTKRSKLLCRFFLRGGRCGYARRIGTVLIEHDPYVLISAISALHGAEWTIGEVGGTIQMLFDKQYILTETVTTETRYRTETRTGTTTCTAPDL